MTLNLMRSLILISLPFCCQSAFAPAIAQITPDNTLGAESSVVTPNVNINGIPSERIDGGAIRDTNLFHSFQELNVGEGRGAYFSNPSGIENILGRVTGINRSNILGTLGVLGNANLFLINPNGIIFGPNARLDLRGSFVGSTADSLMFGNGFDFSATNPQAPPLLTVNIPIGLRFREPAAPILVQGVGQNLGLEGASGSFDPAFGGLRVQPGETLTLAGGNVLLDGGILEAPGGRVELGGLAAAGTLGLNPDLSFAADTVASADVTLTNKAGINVIAKNGGNIAINAQNLNISQASLLTAGIGLNQGFDGSEAGDIQLNATGAITIAASRIENNVNFDAIGNSGDINIITGSLFLTDNAQLDTSTFGQGIGGDILIDALDRVALTDSGIFSTDSEFNSGSPGNVLINANNQVSLIGSLIDSTSNNNDTSNTSDFGRIIILSPEGLVSLNQSLLDTTNAGSGFAGDIEINARDEISLVNSNIISQGLLGRIFIGESVVLPEFTPPTKVTLDTAILTTSTGGANEAGDITINALDTVGINNSIINNDANNFTGDPNNFVSGLAGDVTITANNQISFTGSSIDSTSNNSGTEDFGTEQNFSTISLEAPSGSVFLNQSSLDNSNLGTGLAGDIVIDARDRIAVANSNLASEGLQGRVLIGELIIPTNVIIDNTELTARTSNVDTAGDIIINALDTVAISNSNIANSANNFTGDIDNFTPGFAGNVIIQGNNQVSIISSQIDSTSFNDIRIDGEFSTIRIAAPEGSVDLNQATVDNTNFGSGFAGDIIINARDRVSINNQSTITADGVDGRIFIGAAQDSGETFSPTTVSIDGFSSLRTNNLDNQSPNDVSIDAGSVNIAAIDNIFITNGSTLEAFTSRNGNAGDVILQAENGEVTLSNSSILNTVEPEGISNERGSIEITTGSLSLIDGGAIVTTTFGEMSTAGDIEIFANDAVEIRNSLIASDAFSQEEQEEGVGGLAGSINISANNLVEIAGSDITTDSVGGEFGQGGAIAIAARNIFIFSTETESDIGTESNRSNISSRAFISGSAGSISIGNEDSQIIEIRDSDVASDADTGLAGNLDINASQQVSIVDSSITSTSNNSDISDFSNIRILAPEGSVDLNQATVDNTNFGSGFAGDIIINARDEVSINNQSTITADGVDGRIFIGAAQDSGETFSPTTVSIDGFSSLRTNNLDNQSPNDVSIDAGSVNIAAIDNIFITNGSTLEAFTSRNGNAGLIFLQAENGEVSLSNSRIFSTVTEEVMGEGVMGNGGGIGIRAESLSLRNSTIDAGTFGQGRAGDIIVDVDDDVSLRNSTIFGDVVEGAMGDGGSITIEAESLSLRDESILTTRTEGQGSAGRITINARERVAVRDRSQIESNSETSGQTAGNISITADTLLLEEAPEGENQANIRTNTRGIEGNINLRVRGLILRQGGRIFANASEEAEGGNITIDNTAGLVALENSDITANAQQGRGGEVRITAQGVFGTEFREQLTPESDITATSELGREFFGTVEINRPDVDPSRGLVTLPVNVVDPASLIADNPCQEGEGSEFTVTGRGGLPSNPGESLRRDAVRVDLVEPAQSGAGEQGGTRGQEDKGTRGEKPLTTSSAEKIVPAQGWVSNEKGEVVLTAYAPTSTTPQRPWSSPNPACPAP